jgi:hydroxymethylpyrimidine/phosphomethylpyrimidine kinase
MSVITALTSQNTTGVSGIHIIPSNFVAQQIQDVMTDIPPKCIKTGTCQLYDAYQRDVIK